LLYYGFNGIEGSATAYQSILYMWFELPDGDRSWKALNFQNPST
jgi:hypothetical protein